MHRPGKTLYRQKEEMHYSNEERRNCSIAVRRDFLIEARGDKNRERKGRQCKSKVKRMQN